MRDAGPDSHLRIPRRGVLAGGAMGALSMWQNRVTAAPAEGRAKSVIMIFNCGAPSHTDLWDMKPEATDAVRGEFSPIDTNVPGIQISELMPQVAKRADKLAIVRTVHHEHSAHNSGMYWTTVGRAYSQDSTLINPSRADFPCFGTLIGWLAQRDGYSGAIPPYVITPAPHCDSNVYLTPGQFGGCLGSQFDPFVLNADPSDRGFQVPNMGLHESVSEQRLAGRRELLQSFDGEGAWGSTRLSDEMGVARERAMALVQTKSAGDAFDLTKERPETRDRYGRHSWGQSHLLARRLVESGVRFVSTVNGPSITWDTHKDNFSRMKNSLVPRMEQSYVALLDDLSERGLLDSTLVIWVGDFGRTPIINKDAGRDHWPHCYSVVLAGGGIRGGQVVGESDKEGGRPWSRAVTPADIHATVFAALGYPARDINYQMHDGRPIPVCVGEPIRELLGGA
jgi:hypothetical protein